jgi:hypothetical protein
MKTKKTTKKKKEIMKTIDERKIIADAFYDYLERLEEKGIDNTYAAYVTTGIALGGLKMRFDCDQFGSMVKDLLNA